MAVDKAAGSMKIDVALVRELAQLLTDTDLTEIEVEDDDRRIRVARQGATAVVSTVAPMAAAAAPAVAAPAAPSAVAAAPTEHAGTFKSPMVGTVYLQPEPGAPQYKSVGDSVKEGETVLIIEAMKVMNAIPAPSAGKVLQILVENGQPVEYDQPLFVIG